MTTTITITNVRISTVLGDDRTGWDCDATVTLDGRELRGELTLVPDHEGRPSAWGSIDNWMSSPLCDELRGQRELLGEIEAEARAECERVIREARERAEES